jgi:hypothetical protein
MSQNLYIRFDENEEKQFSYPRRKYDLVDKVERNERGYYMDYYVYQGHPLQFVSKKRSQAQIITTSQLSNYAVKTPMYLNTLLKPKSEDEQMQYFHSFQKIFIVDINNRNQQATLTEVEIDVDIE